MVGGTRVDYINLVNQLQTSRKDPESTQLTDCVHSVFKTDDSRGARLRERVAARMAEF